MNRYSLILGLSILWAATVTCAGVPDEFESAGGHSLGLGNGGSSAVSGQGSVRNNPAMLSLEKQYSISGAYHWPSQGREFYQVGAVDSKTSPVAAGIGYTSSLLRYGTDPEAEDQEVIDPKGEQLFDSPIDYRFSLALSRSYSRLAVGMAGHYVEGYTKSESGEYITSKGATIGLGIAGLLTKELRFGLSVENLANDGVRDLAPRFIRGGLAYTLFGGNFTTHLDYVYRDRVTQELLQQDDAEQFVDVEFADSEQMLTISSSARIQNLLRVLLSYGQDFSSANRRMLSGGLALVNQSYSMSYLVSRPYLGSSKIHHAINLTLHVAI